MMKFSPLKLIITCSVMLGVQPLWAQAVEFDRPGEAFGTGIVPKGHVAWEQALPTTSYDEYSQNGVKRSQINVQGDVLLRAGIGFDTELRLGWDGPMWQRQKIGTHTQEIDGVGDVQIGIKKAINLDDEKLKWAVLAQVNLATGDDEFTSDDEIYTLGSSLVYDFDQNIQTGLTMLYEIQDGDLALTAIPNIQYPIAGNVSGFSEYVYRKQEHKHYESVVNTGLTWSPLDKLQLDASVGYSFNRQNPQFNAGLGVAYLF